MKIIRPLRLSLLGLLLASTGVMADSGDSTLDPYAQLDPDGVPLSVTRVQQKPMTQEEIDSSRKQQEAAAQNRNWLLRGYEEQQQLHAKPGDAADPSSNLYMQLTANKALARLAGLPEADSTNPSLKTGVSPGPSSLRKDPTARAAAPLPSATNLSKPLISPLSSPAGVSSISSTQPFAMKSPFGDILPAPTSVPAAPAPSPDLTDLDTPGMTAAKKDPLDMGSSDLTLDMLPGESVEDARTRQENFKAELALPVDADQIHRQQAAASTTASPQKAPTQAQPKPDTQPTAQNDKPQDDPNAPTPISQVPQISPVHAPIANPFDILRR